ncbi:hypothetical protein NKH21_26900 [Mesorhizobium sp. M1329]
MVEILWHQVRGPQLAVEIVAPSVIWAGEYPLAAFRLQADTRAAVAADIVEGVHGARSGSQDDDALGPDLEQEVVTRIGNPAFVVDQKPLTIQQHPHIGAEYVLRQIKGLRQTMAWRPVEVCLRFMGSGYDRHGAAPIQFPWF